jgi:hypothetical protein
VLGRWFLGQCSDNIRLKNFASANRVFLILPNVLVCNMNLPTIFKTMGGGCPPPPPLGTPLCLDFVIRPG